MPLDSTEGGKEGKTSKKQEVKRGNGGMDKEENKDVGFLYCSSRLFLTYRIQETRCVGSGVYEHTVPVLTEVVR